MNIVLRRFLDTIGRHTLCRLGLHSKPVGIGLDACERGCCYVHNPGAAKRYEVVLVTGERYEVTAINEYHAGSQVVYGEGRGSMDQFGNSIEPVKVHRDNIKYARLLEGL